MTVVGNWENCPIAKLTSKVSHKILENLRVNPCHVLIW